MEENKIISTDFMKIEKVDDKENYSDNDRFIKLDSSAASQISSMMHVLPSAFAGNALSGAYRVVFPKGMSGVLVPHNGGSLAIMRDPVTKDFLAHGTLYGLNDIGLMYNVFSALSVATGQYFMREIDQSLQDIQKRLDQVLDFLYTDKSCELYAEAQMVYGIYNNCVSIMRCPEQRTAALQSLQHAKVLAERNIQFYYRDMDKLGVKRDSLNNLENDLNNYTQAVSLYGVCATMEIVLSENYDETYMKYIEEDLKRHVEKHHEEVGKLKGMVISMPKPAATPFKAAPKSDPDKARILKHIEKLLGQNSPVKGYSDVIARMREEYTEKSEFRIVPDGSVYKCKTA